MFPHGFEGRPVQTCADIFRGLDSSYPTGRTWFRLEMRNTWVLDKGMSEEYKEYNLSCRRWRRNMAKWLGLKHGR
jgi:hypothetical protein